MEYEKGKYYEIDFITNIKEHQHAILKIIDKYQSVVISDFGGLKGYEEGKIVYFDYHEPYNVKRIFEDIHEVSSRIKEIEAEKEKESWPVKVGQIWEIKTNNNSCYFILIKDVFEKAGKNFNDYRCCVDVIHNHKTEGDSSSESYYLSPEYSNTTLLTQEQYEQRLEELEQPKFEVGDWFELIDCDYAMKISAVDKDFVWAVGNANYPYDLIKPITEQEAVKLITGKDYVLLNEGWGLYEKTDIDQWYKASCENDVANARIEAHKDERRELREELQIMTQNRDAWIRSYHDIKAKHNTVQTNSEEDREKIRLLESKLSHLRAAKELQEKNHARTLARKRTMINNLTNNFTNSIEDRLHLGKQLEDQKAKYLRLAKAHNKLKKKYKKATSINVSVTPRITTEVMQEKIKEIKGWVQDDTPDDTKDLF